MEPWPAVAWVLLLTVLSDSLRTSQSRDFTEQDIAYLYPSKARYCYSRHKMNIEGDSVSVTKRCVALEDCLATGCTGTDHEGNKVCTACCEGNICNIPIPWNETEAVFAYTSPLSGSPGPSRTYALTLCPALLAFLLSNLA
ncbi:hypothetical protein NHX12_007503 [Muraenolepis orangiensis]|uniref:Ly6/PLAUR domain-containing protein 6 n=1 Tax=Muraenolepis orangiensis TaxID=630683 RepID=A0A9Q0ID28_9TELE|nr:hypothetical protein NHX12_007503 [Muraenolepis orangiensis]